MVLHARTVRCLFVVIILATFVSSLTTFPGSTISRRATSISMSTSLESVCKDRTSKIFVGNTVLLTGASGGLGRSLALQLAHSRVHTLVLSGRNEEGLESVANECKSINPEIVVHIITCDLSNKASVTELSAKSLELCNQRIDVLINNGGVSSRSRFLDTKVDVDEKVMQINFFAGSALAKGVVPGMVERGYGKIIWIGSVQGLFGIPNRTSYASSKFAVQGYCEALRSELADSGISVHVASPGYIRTNLSKSAITGDGGSYNKVDAATAAGADPNDVAIDILDKVAIGQADFVTAATISAKAAIWLKFFAPSVLRKQLVKRYRKSLLSQGE